MRAYVLRDIGKFGIEEVKRPVPAQGEVIVQVKAAGICGSDISRVYRHGTYSYPLIPGHEYSGIVVETGREYVAADNSYAQPESEHSERVCAAGIQTSERVCAAGIQTSERVCAAGIQTSEMEYTAGNRTFGEDMHGGRIDSWIGKRVGIFPLIPCGECIPCRQGKYEMCRHYSYLGSRRDGGFAEYVSVPVWNLVELPKEVSYEQAAMMEPMAVAVHAMRKALSDDLLNMDLRIVICGLGTIGLFLLMFLKEAGYEDILVIGNKDIQREKALALGISEGRFCDNRDKGADAWLGECTREKGIDVFFECVGNNETLNLAVGHTAPGGSVMLVGNPASDMILDRQTYWKILRNQLTLHGTWNSSYLPDNRPFGSKESAWGSAVGRLPDDGRTYEDDWQYVLDRLAAGRVHPEALITHRYDFDGLIRGFELMRDKTEEYLKIMFQS